MSTLNIKIEFGGGSELLFSNQRSHQVAIPAEIPSPASTGKGVPPNVVSGRPANLTYLMYWLRDNLLKEREELFIENGTVRPGILVLINDTDWELEGEGDYVLKDGDEIVFISTLHGG